jgi:glycosyltransferase involved in cell wall biosynthesis
MIKVLYIHHVGTFGGASRSLLEIIKSFPENSVDACLISQKGNTVDFFQKAGVKTIEAKGISQFDNGRYYHYNGLRWLILLRELVYLPFTFLAIIKAKKIYKDFDIIHINEIQLIIPALFAKKIFKRPIVIHSRSLQQSDLKSFRTRIIRDQLLKIAEIIIPIDKAVEQSLPVGLNTRVVHNGFDPVSLLTNMNTVNEWSKVRKRRLNIGMVGNIIRHKGMDEFVEAARILVTEGFDINFIIVGDKTAPRTILAKILKGLKISHDIREDLVKKIDKYKLEKYFYLLPFTSNLSYVYPQFDVLCFPNQTDAIGRPVFEAAYFKKPSIVCLSSILGDTFIDKETGLNVEAKNPLALVKAIKYFYNNLSEIERMGLNAYNLAINTHNSKLNAIKILDIYKEIVNKNDR